MSLIPLDTRVALAAQAPQIDFNQLTRNTLDLYDNVKQRGQQGTLSRLLAQNTGLDGQMDLSGALLSAQTDPKQAYQANTVTTLAGLIQQQNAAKYKAQQDAIKFKADTAKTDAETGKLSQEGVGKGLENTQKSQTSLANLIATSIDPLDASNKLKMFGQQYGLPKEVQDGLQSQIGAIATMEDGGKSAFEQIKQSYGLLGAEKPIEYMQPNANTVASNETSIKTTGMNNDASKYGTDVVAKTAEAKLVQEGKQFTKEQELSNWIAKNKPLGTETGSDGYLYAVYPNNKGVRVSDQNGQPISVQRKGSGAMSATMQKELIQTDDAISSGQAVISGLQDALKLNDSSYDGFTASPRAKTAGFIGYDDERAKNTVLIDNIATGNALDALKSTFGAAPTEGERKILLELQGSVNLPAPQRKAIWDRGIAAAKKRIEYNQGKADAIRNGSFTSTTYKPYMGESPPQGGVGGNAANGGSSGKPNAMTFFKPPQ